jgi:hypothetical protein
MRDNVKNYDMGGIWFRLHFEDGQLAALEEHDWREGGYVEKREDETWEDFTIRRARNRVIGEDYKTKVETDIRKIIKDNSDA